LQQISDTLPASSKLHFKSGGNPRMVTD